ncbi:uncharacterized protein LOC132783416 [Drosophila nasuta]|uniref:uncharacterized protein LOC132783416 n=1 Tax=Drosophila nasuta TaxID=42062 RepID=UPI00295E4D9A|nr:uncharacterized protein LOC132783416 [Drosophila nasuta]
MICRSGSWLWINELLFQIYVARHAACSMFHVSRASSCAPCVEFSQLSGGCSSYETISLCSKNHRHLSRTSSGLLLVQLVPQNVPHTLSHLVPLMQVTSPAITSVRYAEE